MLSRPNTAGAKDHLDGSDRAKEHALGGVRVGAHHRIGRSEVVLDRVAEAS